MPWIIELIRKLDIVDVDLKYKKMFQFQIGSNFQYSFSSKKIRFSAAFALFYFFIFDYREYAMLVCVCLAIDDSDKYIHKLSLCIDFGNHQCQNFGSTFTYGTGWLRIQNTKWDFIFDRRLLVQQYQGQCSLFYLPVVFSLTLCMYVYTVWCVHVRLYASWCLYLE